MIKITKLDKPDILAQHDTQWTEEYLNALGRNATSDIRRTVKRYKHIQIKETLMAETYKKCAYCESYIESVSYPDIEHIIPKSSRPELTFDWDNLTLGCQRCNRNKGTYYDEQLTLINPYQDDIADHLMMYGAMVLEVSADRGKLTKNKLKLNRQGLLNARRMAIEKVHDLIIARDSCSDEGAKTALEQQIRMLAEDENEYAGTIRAYLSEKGILA